MRRTAATTNKLGMMRGNRRLILIHLGKSTQPQQLVECREHPIDSRDNLPVRTPKAWRSRNTRTLKAVGQLFAQNELEE
jgi:hypothetical protein